MCLAQGPVKKVIDSSALRSDSLRQFLAGSPHNIAILTGHLAMELFKGDGQTNVLHSLRHLADFPRQVAVLKSTGAMFKLQPRAQGLQARLIDEEQTEGFALYCKMLFDPQTTQADIAADRRRKQAVANARFHRLNGNVEAIRQAIQQLKKRYQPDELKALRRKKELPMEFWFRFSDDLFDSTLAFHRLVPGLPALRDGGIFYTYAFRYSLCAYACAVDWIAEGGFEQTSGLTNDFTDMGYAACATFYDGLLTEDQKQKELYTFARRLLERVFLKARNGV